MQTLSPTISPTISSKKVTESETEYLPAIAQSSVMQTALAGLDASLNDELDRYRHWQENGQTISYLNPFRPRAISTQSIWTSPSLSDALSPLAPVTETPSSDRRTIQMPVMPPLSEASSASAINLSAAELHNYSGLHSGLKNDGLNNDAYNNGLSGFDHLNDQIKPNEANYAQPMHSYAPEGMGINEPIMAKVPLPDDDEILQNFANDYANHYEENYQEQVYPNVPVPPAPAEKSALRSLMNPVGIISLLLLLCSSAAIGYLLVDPSGVMKLFKPDAKPKSAQTEKVGEDLGSDINLQNQQQLKDSSLSFVPLAGDSNANPPIDSLQNNKNTKGLTNTKNLFATPSTKSANSSNLFAPNSSTFVPNAPLRTVPSTPLPPLAVAPLPPALAPVERSYNPAPRTRSYEAPATSSSSNASNSTRSTRSNNSNNSTSYSEARNSAPRTSNPVRASVVPTTAPSATPSTSRTAAVKYAAPLSSAPAPASAPVASSYRVVVENSYAASAQQVERDAFVRPSDGQVQVGSYRDANAAQQRIEQLRRQGIPARIE